MNPSAITVIETCQVIMFLGSVDEAQQQFHLWGVGCPVAMVLPGDLQVLFWIREELLWTAVEAKHQTR